MKIIATSLLGLIATCSSALAETKLVLSTDKEIYEAGWPVKVSLTLQGTSIEPTPPSKKKYAPQSKNRFSLFFTAVEGSPALSYSYNLTADKKGQNTIGPFSIEVGKEKLTSNTVTYSVVTPAKNGLSIYLSSKTVQKGEEFSIIVISPKLLDKPTLRKNKFFEFKGVNKLTYTSLGPENGDSTTYRYSFVVESKKKGKLKVSRELFANLPEVVNILVTDITIY